MNISNTSANQGHAGVFLILLLHLVIVLETKSTVLNPSLSQQSAASAKDEIAVGYLSSLLGIGGGIIHVPVLVHVLNFPVHIAMATSHFVLAIMALSGSVTHLVTGVLQKGIYQTVGLGIGAIVGAQLGARLSKRFHGRFIIQSLAVALFLVGVRIFVMGIF